LIIGDAEHRHKFVQEALQYTPGAEDALAYLQQVHSRFLPRELAAGEDGSAEGINSDISSSGAAVGRR
jgi:hypothetical protein